LAPFGSNKKIKLVSDCTNEQSILVECNRLKQVSAIVKNYADKEPKAASDGQPLSLLDDNRKFIYEQLHGNNEQEHCCKQLQSLTSVLLPPSSFSNKQS